MNKISESVLVFSDSIKDLSAAISEQVGGVSEINGAVSQIVQNTKKQAASFEEVTAAGSALSTEAEALKRSTARIKTSGDIVDFKFEKPTLIVRKSQNRITPDKSGNLAINLNGWGAFKKRTANGSDVEKKKFRRMFYRGQKCCASDTVTG